ncbi:hypothetical protein ACET3Z_028278 [Daucus carota]
MSYSYLWNLCPLVAIAGSVYIIVESQKLQEKRKKHMNEVRKDFKDSNKRLSSYLETAQSLEVAQKSCYNKLKEFKEALANLAPVSSQGDGVLAIASWSGLFTHSEFLEDITAGDEVDRRAKKTKYIVNEHIKAELDAYSEKASLSDALCVNGLRYVFGEVYPDSVQIVSIGREVEDLLANPEDKMWSSTFVELFGGTHISNTREAKAFVLLSEEGIAEGILRVTAVTRGNGYCIARVSVGSDNAAIREAVVQVIEQKKIAVMVFSTALKPLHGKGGGGKGGLAQGQGSHISNVEEVMKDAETYANQKLKETDGI